MDRPSARPPATLRRLRRRLLRGALAGLAAALPLLALRGTPALRVAEAKTYDLRAGWLADPSAASREIVFAAIDDNSLEAYRDRLGRWPWPRDVYAVLLDYLHASGARLVVFDVLFPEPDRAHPAADSAFAEAIAGSGFVVLPLTFTPGRQAEAEAWERRREREQPGFGRGRAELRRFALGPAGAGAVRDLAYAEPPLALFARGARGLGSVTLNADRDGVVRGERPVAAHRGELYPALSLAAARALAPERFGGPVEARPDRLRVGREVLPLDRGRLLLRWRGPYLAGGRAAYRIYPVFHLLNSWEQVRTGRAPDVPMAELRGKVVFVAATGVGLFDARATPLRPADPGALIHATALDNLLRRDWLRRAPAAANLAAVLLTALAAGIAASVFGSAALGGGAALLVLALSGGAAFAAYAQGVWLDLAAPLLGGGVAFAGAMSAGWVAEGREKRRVRELFGRYVSPEYVRRLAEDPDSVRLGGERVPLTVLFSDIRGFTSLSERLPAERVIELLNEYLEAMAAVVFRHGGTLDKFIGDAVMAFWGAPVPAPDHARRALDAALDMLRELDALNARWRALGAPAELRIGIGVSTGEAVVGNIGSLSRKLDYTAIGDTVNLASRLEGLNKELGTSVLASEATRAAAGDGYEFHPLGDVRVKGKEATVQVFELRGRTEARGRAPGVTAGVTAAALLLAALAAGAFPAAAQERAQWSAAIYRPGVWSGGRVVPAATRDPGTDSLALVGRAQVYSQPPRWRADVRAVLPGDRLGEPVVLVSSGGEVRVVTPVGSTPLAEHAAARDPLVQAVVRQFGPEGAPREPGAARVVDRSGSGQVEWVTLRRPAARADFSESVFQTGRAGLLGRQAVRLGVRAAGGERRQEAVASAGARGVTRVRTARGEIEVNPDAEGVRRMAAFEAGPQALDRFQREGRVGTHAPGKESGR